MSNAKQVIVIRRDLKMRRGKEAAQAAHASSLWWMKRLYNPVDGPGHPLEGYAEAKIRLTPEEAQWLNGEYRKVVCQVPGLHELEDLYVAACMANLEAHFVIDQGATEFHGVPTITALAIGPDYAEKIDPITHSLSLY